MALTHPSWTVDTTFSGKNIASAASVYTFTAAAAGKVQFCVKATVAGNGDYVVYLTHQWLGTGTAAVVLPKTTAAAASGETVIEFVSQEIAVKATDVVDVMIDGLAGDNSVSGAIRISADNPSVFDQANDVPAVNVTYQAGVAVAAADTDGNILANVRAWKDETPADLDGAGRVPVGSMHEIALSSFDGNDNTVTASDPTQVKSYLVGLVVALEFAQPIP